MEFYREIVVSAIGMDCPATQAWVIRLVNDNIAAGVADALAARRAAIHWDAADDELRDAIGTKLGWTDPGARLTERWPVPPALKADYEAAVEFISQALC